ncbi:hypothetical protein VP01_106g5 [Puccinia sorghi]|uniref:MT-A70-domain-containing protein n=1 Tax=Puccinia sorghi TaxID=27349 RepID=A0A0L6VTR3_9BASI|nr:hypothetical protein VP01_106g5 [Puccinia sorghi]
MSQGSEPSSVLLEIPLSERNLTAYLLDPFIPLLRGFDETTRVTALRPPSEPHIVRAPSSPNPPNLAAIIDREIGPAKRARLDRPGAPSSFPGMSGQTSNNLPLTGFQLEAAHHASIKDDIQHAIDVIRRQWVNMTCGPNSHSEWWLDPHALSHPALAQLELLSYPTATSSNPWLDWPTLTRDSLEVRKTQFTSDNIIIFLLLPLTFYAIRTVGTTCLNRSSNSVGHATLTDQKCIVTLPKRSGFSLATMENFKNEVMKINHSPGWDAVIIDPPWQNKSVERGDKYRTVELYDLFKMDLPGILGDNRGKRALIAIWVTNRPKFRRFLKKKFMPDCHVLGPYSEWYWVKITASPTNEDQSVLLEGGKPIFDLESTSPRRCYEGLVLGWYIPPSLRPNPPLTALPRKIFLSVPLGHSRKPNIMGKWMRIDIDLFSLLDVFFVGSCFIDLLMLTICSPTCATDLLVPHLPPDPSILELFSRSVSGLPSLGKNGEPHSDCCVKGIWHSIGDECSKFMVAPWVDSSKNTERQSSKLK